MIIIIIIQIQVHMYSYTKYIAYSMFIIVKQKYFNQNK